MLKLLQERRSIRKYTTKQLEEHIIDALKEAALRSPSSRGINPWEFIFVDEPELLVKLAASKQHGSTFLKGAVLGVVVCADERKSDVWVEDCSIASIILQLAAKSCGLGSCWIQIRNRKHNESTTSEDYIRQVLNIPEQIKVESIIALGYPDESKEPHPKSSLEYSKIYMNRYGI